MATPLGTTFVTDEQIVVQGDVLYKGKMVESLVVEFDQAKYEEFLSSGSKSPNARAYRRVSTEICLKIRSEILSNATAVKDVVANRAMRNTRAMRLSGDPRGQPLWYPSNPPPSSAPGRRRSSEVPLNFHDATGTLNGGRGGVRVNYKLEQLIVQQRQNARFRLCLLYTSPSPRDS